MVLLIKQIWCSNWCKRCYQNQKWCSTTSKRWSKRCWYYQSWKSKNTWWRKLYNRLCITNRTWKNKIWRELAAANKSGADTTLITAKHALAKERLKKTFKHLRAALGASLGIVSDILVRNQQLVKQQHTQCY
jgi:hypothetical protein